MTLNIVIPASGRGQRFVEAGFVAPKPFIPVLGKPMISRAIVNVKPSQPHQFTVIVQKDHLIQSKVAGIYDCRLVVLDGVTEGAACSILKAKDLINSEDPLLIFNSDQLLDWSVDQFLETAGPWDGAIATFKASSPAYSYVRVEWGFVKEVAEKRVISDEATAGAYYWRRGSDFVRCAEQMIAQDKRVNGEFYVCPVFQELIDEGGKVVAIPVAGVTALGTPEDLAAYIEKVAA